MKSLTIGVYDYLWLFQVHNRCILKKKFKHPITLRALLGTISSFPRLHVSLIVSKEPVPISIAYQEPNDKVLFMINSGSQGTANNSLSGLEIATDEIYVYYWAHNMYPWNSDFHGDIVIFYEEGE